MPVAQLNERKIRQFPRGVMKANVFHPPGRYGLEELTIPRAGAGEAVVQVRLTTICETDIDLVDGLYPVDESCTLGHDAVGVIHEPVSYTHLTLPTILRV